MCKWGRGGKTFLYCSLSKGAFILTCGTVDPFMVRNVHTLTHNLTNLLIYVHICIYVYPIFGRSHGYVQRKFAFYATPPEPLVGRLYLPKREDLFKEYS